METIKTEIKLDSSRYEILSGELTKLHLTLEELINKLINQYVSEIALTKKQPASDFMSIVDLGESGLNDVSENHDQYLGEIIANEHLH